MSYLQAGTSGHEHDPALLALLYLPVVVVGLLVFLEAGHHRGLAPATRLRGGYLALLPAQQLALLLVAMAAAIHLALAPGHWSEDPLRAVLFVLDFVALSAVAVAALATRRWRGAAVGLLSANVFAYAFYVLTGREGVDAVGIFTQFVELAALVLVLVGHRAEQPSELPGRSRATITREVLHQ